MMLVIRRTVMRIAWTLDEWANELVAWAEQKYSDEVHGIGRIQP